MNDGELISVIMPAYNAVKHIAASIETVVQQTYQHWELIIVDDGSTDKTASIINYYTNDDVRIKYVYQQNGKQGKARNTGIWHAQGNFIAFLDADDLWMKDKLEKQIAFIKETNADLVFADVIMINALGEEQKNTWGVKDMQYKGEEGILAFMLQNRAPLLSVLAKKDVLKKAGGFLEATGMQYVEDYDLWFRLLKADAVFASSSQKLAAYRLHDNLSRERRATILNVIDILKSIGIQNRSLNTVKNRALKIWIRRFIKTCLPHITADELNKIISLFPYAAERFFFSGVSKVFGNSISANAMLVYLKKSANKEFKRRQTAFLTKE